MRRPSIRLVHDIAPKTISIGLSPKIHVLEICRLAVARDVRTAVDLNRPNILNAWCGSKFSGYLSMAFDIM